MLVRGLDDDQERDGQERADQSEGPAEQQDADRDRQGVQAAGAAHQERRENGALELLEDQHEDQDQQGAAGVLGQREQDGRQGRHDRADGGNQFAQRGQDAEHQPVLDAQRQESERRDGPGDGHDQHGGAAPRAQVLEDLSEGVRGLHAVRGRHRAQQAVHERYGVPEDEHDHDQRDERREQAAHDQRDHAGQLPGQAFAQALHLLAQLSHGAVRDDPVDFRVQVQPVVQAAFDLPEVHGRSLTEAAQLRHDRRNGQEAQAAQKGDDQQDRQDPGGGARHPAFQEAGQGVQGAGQDDGEGDGHQGRRDQPEELQGQQRPDDQQRHGQQVHDLHGGRRGGRAGHAGLPGSGGKQEAPGNAERGMRGSV